MNVNPEDRIPISYKGFLYRKANKALIINSTDFDRAVKVMREDKIGHLEINSNFFQEEDLNFLNRFTFIEGLSIISQSVKDISPVQVIPGLKILNIDHKLAGAIDFQHFEHLEECLFVWGMKGCETIFNNNSIQKLRIDNYNKLEPIEFSSLGSLKSVSLYNSKIVSLLGLNTLSHLTKLDVTGSRYLEDIKGLDGLLKLEELRLDGCKSLTSFDALTELKQLRLLSFSNIGNLSSIKCLKSLDKLEEIFFSDNTNIEDGDLTSLEFLYRNASLKKAIFTNRKHYTHKPQELGYKVPDIVANIFRQK